MSTLADILELLPDVGRQRLSYNPTFWVRKANQLLGIIETEARGPDLYVEAFVPFVGRQTLYAVPKPIRKLLRVRVPDEYGIMNLGLPSTEVGFTPRGDRLIQLRSPAGITPQIASFTQTVGSSSVITNATAITQAIDEGWGAIITHTASGEIEYRRVLSFDADTNAVTLDGPTLSSIVAADDDPVVAADTAVVVDAYMIFEGQRSLTRFVSEDSPSPLPQEWDRVLEMGLRWALEFQSDEEGASQNATDWFDQFRDALDRYAGDVAERPGDMNRVEPRGGSHWGIML